MRYERAPIQPNFLCHLGMHRFENVPAIVLGRRDKYLSGFRACHRCKVIMRRSDNLFFETLRITGKAQLDTEWLVANGLLLVVAQTPEVLSI